MFSATQSITPLRDYSDNLRIQKTKRPNTINAKPACWSQNLLTNLSAEVFQTLSKEFYVCQGYKLERITESEGYNSFNFTDTNTENGTLLVACANDEECINITLVKDFCDHASEINATRSFFITQGTFSSGALDFCARKEIRLISNRELLSDILKLDASVQNTLLDEINSIS